MDKVKSFFSENKKYFVLAVTFVLGGLTAINVPVPGFVPALLSAIGLQ